MASVHENLKEFPTEQQRGDDNSSKENLIWTMLKNVGISDQRKCCVVNGGEMRPAEERDIMDARLFISQVSI